MISLTSKYQPKRIADFAGLRLAKAMMGKLSAEPWESAWLFCGDSGTGKTTLALALASELGAQLIHVPSSECTVEKVRWIRETCQCAPMFGDWYVCLIDEADRMTPTAQIAFLSLLDATSFPKRTVFIFTCNSVDKLEDRFMSRCRVIPFDGGIESKDVANFLFGVWVKETGRIVGAPIMRDLIAGNGGNIRGALMRMELDILTAECAE